jgi:hypothetical protein
MRKMNVIEAFQALKAGKKIRGTDWKKEQYVYLDGSRIVNEYGCQAQLYDIRNFKIRDWEEYIEILKIEVELNDEYTAVVDIEGVVVGCQTFSLEKFDELAKAVKKVRDNAR